MAQFENKRNSQSKTKRFHNADRRTDRQNNSIRPLLHLSARYTNLTPTTDFFLTSESLDSIIDGQDVDPLAILDFRACLDGDDVSQSDAQVVTHDAVQSDLVVRDRVVGQNDANRLTTLFA